MHEVWVGVIYFMTPSSLKPKREAGVFFQVQLPLPASYTVHTSRFIRLWVPGSVQRGKQFGVLGGENGRDRNGN